MCLSPKTSPPTATLRTTIMTLCITEVASGVLLLCRCRAVPGSTPGTPVGAGTTGDDPEQLLGADSLAIGLHVPVCVRKRHPLSLYPGSPCSLSRRCPGPAWRLLARASVPTLHLGDAPHRLTQLPNLPGRAREACRPTPLCQPGRIRLAGIGVGPRDH